MIGKLKKIPLSEATGQKVAKLNHAVTHTAHFCYFCAAAIGAHDFYAVAAAVIVVGLIISYSLQLPTEA